MIFDRSTSVKSRLGVKLISAGTTGVQRGSIQTMREKCIRACFAATAAIAIAATLLICAFLLVNGVPTMAKVGLFDFLLGTTWRPENNLYGIAPMIVGSIYVTAGALLVAVPAGLLCAVFLSCFAGARFGGILGAGVELLAGIPSVMYGFFGLVVIVPCIRGLGVGNGMSIISASLILGVMILPTVVTVSRNALDAVPASYYEGALALGTDHEYAVYKVVVPAASSGIATSIVLGLGRALGETMAVVMVAGNNPAFPNSLFSGVRTLTANIVLEMGYATGMHREVLIATGVVLLVFILLVTLLLNATREKGEMK